MRIELVFEPLLMLGPQLATLIKKLKKNEGGDKVPFTYYEITDFMPKWAGARKASQGKNLTMAGWLAAYQNFALAASATGMWDYASSYAHIRTCMRIAWEKRKLNKRGKLVYLYDKIARKKWSEKDQKGCN